MKRMPSLAVTVYREESASTGELVDALCRACLNFIPVVFDKTGKRDGVEYRYASIMSIRRSTQVPLAKEGLFLHHCYGHNNEGEYVISVLRHKSGEYISSTLRLPLLPDVQERGASMTFLCRKATEGLLAITTEEDDDGASVGQEEMATDATPPTASQIAGLDLALTKIRQAKNEAELARYQEMAAKRIEEGAFHRTAVVPLQTLINEVRASFTTKESADADQSGVAGDEGAGAARSGGRSPRGKRAGGDDSVGRGDVDAGHHSAAVAAG